MDDELDPFLPDPDELAPDPVEPGTDEDTFVGGAHTGQEVHAEQEIALDPAAWIALDDGTRLQVFDADRDGVPDASVQEFSDGYVVATGLDTDTPVYELYDSNGEFIGIYDHSGMADDGDSSPEQRPWPEQGNEVQDQTWEDPQDPLTQEEAVEPSEGLQPLDDVEGIIFVTEEGRFETPPLDLDISGDGTPDAVAIRTDDGNVVVLVDSNLDGLADQAFVETPSGNVTLWFDGVEWQVLEDDGAQDVDPLPDDGDGSAETDGIDGPVQAPEMYRVEVDPTATAGVQSLQKAQDDYAVMVADVWSSAYPGEPWPLDDEGVPYHPRILAGIIGSDDDLAPDVKALGQRMVEHWDKLMNLAIEPMGAAAQAVSTMTDAVVQNSAVAPPSWEIPLVDGSSLVLTDSDFDGDADVLVRQYGDRFVVTTNADSDHPTHLTFTSDGRLVDRSEEGDFQPSDQETVWEGEVTPVTPEQPVDPMEAEIWEDSAFWYLQEGQTCAIASVVQVIEDFLGHDVDPEEVKAYAMARGWYSDPDPATGNPGGTAGDYVDDLMSAFGVPADLVTLPGPEAMAWVDQQVHRGVAVIAYVDASTYWYGDIWPGEEATAPHAVRVLDVDFERGVVILSDTGIEHGRGLEVPIEQFQHGMSRMGFQVVVSKGVDPDGVGASAPGATTADGPLAESGFALIPGLISDDPVWRRFVSRVRGA